ncbi:hypothetical protein BpHYR1_009587 [Brachionus plicatilis]|uniref:Uncharacterized protein n=1 Tax=Brachionus plicatilis TaxID=10195 RepID=A0A3M7QC78_BRAPC|nr:hypothetical protein BpHYR1_009587 [Brachionus plicatilis]
MICITINNNIIISDLTKKIAQDMFVTSCHGNAKLFLKNINGTEIWFVCYVSLVAKLKDDMQFELLINFAY